MSGEMAFGSSALDIHGAVADWACRRPQHPAVIAVDQTVTYSDLYARSRQLSGRLREHGVRPDEVVALYLPRGHELIVAALAAMMAGAAYLALDVEQPPARIRRLVEHCQTRVAVAGERNWPGGWPGGLAVIDPSREDERMPQLDHDAVADPDSLAYVTYTSGSTGAPKGVMVTRRNLANLVSWYGEQYGITPADRCSQIARPSFDAWALEVWPCLAHGATLCIASPSAIATADRLVSWLHDVRASMSFVPTPLATEVMRRVWPRLADGASFLRTMLVGGDRLSGYPDPGLPFRVFNNYGPTECTVVATCGEVVAGSSASVPPIGYPIKGMRAYVLDAGLKPVPDGHPGELYLAGAGVARGYLGDPGETARKFLDDPFATEPNGCMYATGDLVVRDSSGQLHFRGRLDDQVKINGVRVEPAEVEDVLLRQPGVQAAAVVKHQARAGGPDVLAAYVVMEDSASIRVLEAGLAAELPRAMLPAQIRAVSALPLTPHGKVDRVALARRSLYDDQGAEEPGPVRDLDAVLTELWRDVLGMETVDPHQSFFDLGGDSLRVIRLISKARRSGLSLMPEDVYRHPVLVDLLAALGTPADGMD
jgi:amino acid adenylation domain-containing protein